MRKSVAIYSKGDVLTTFVYITTGTDYNEATLKFGAAGEVDARIVVLISKY